MSGFLEILISVSDYVKSEGPLELFKNGAYVMTKQLFSIINLTKKIYTCKNVLYMTRAYIEACLGITKPDTDHKSKYSSALKTRTLPYALVPQNSANTKKLK